MSLNSKPLCQLATAELFPNETGKQRKKATGRLGLMSQICCSYFMQPREASCLISLTVTNCSGETSFSRSKT